MKKLTEWLKHNWLVLAVLLAYAVLAAVRPEAASQAASRGLTTFAQLLPTLVTIFLLIGLVRVWVSDTFIMTHLGDSSGWKGLLIGAGLGTLMVGPLVGVFPLYESLLMKGARTGVIVAMVSTWAVKIAMIPLEISLLGWRFALVHNALVFAAAFVMAPLMELALGRDWNLRFRERAESAAN